MLSPSSSSSSSYASWSPFLRADYSHLAGIPSISLDDIAPVSYNFGAPVESDCEDENHRAVKHTRLLLKMAIGAIPHATLAPNPTAGGRPIVQPIGNRARRTLMMRRRAVQRMDNIARSHEYTEAAAAVTHRSSQKTRRSLSILHAIEIELIMQCLDIRSLMAFAVTNRTMLLAARKPFSWQFIGEQTIVFKQQGAQRRPFSDAELDVMTESTPTDESRFGSYHPLLLNMFPTRLRLCAEMRMSTNSVKRIDTADIDMMHLLRPTIVEVESLIPDQGSDLSRIDYDETELTVSKSIVRSLLDGLVTMGDTMTTLIVRQSRYVPTVVSRILPRAPHLTCLRIAPCDKGFNQPYAAAIRGLKNLRSLRIDLTARSQCDGKPRDTVYNVLSSTSLHSSLTSLDVKVNWDRVGPVINEVAQIVDSLPLFTSLLRLHLRDYLAGDLSDDDANAIARSIPSSLIEFGCGFDISMMLLVQGEDEQIDDEENDNGEVVRLTYLNQEDIYERIQHPINVVMSENENIKTLAVILTRCADPRFDVETDLWVSWNETVAIIKLTIGDIVAPLMRDRTGAMMVDADDEERCRHECDIAVLFKLIRDPASEAYLLMSGHDDTNDGRNKE